MPLSTLFFVLLVASFITNSLCDSDKEAISLALETSGQLLAPQSLVQKFKDDLMAIRTAYPQVNKVVHTPLWHAGELVVQVTNEQLERIVAEYGQVTSTTSYGYTSLKFTAPYNPIVLAKELKTKNLASYSEPEYDDGEGDSIHYDTQTAVYEFKHGWADCPSGCQNRRFWQFSVSPSGVKLISESVTLGVPEEIDGSW